MVAVTSFTSGLALAVTLWSAVTPITVRAAASRTWVSITDGRWHINGEVTYRGARAEGLLLNVRMVNATFEDRKRPEFDADANSDEFIARIPDYVAHGVRAFTVNLQGGMPGYEGAANSAFDVDGSLRDAYMARVRRVIEADDRLGITVDATRVLDGGDFESAFVDAARHNFWPRSGSALLGRADLHLAPPLDFNGTKRVAPSDVGAYEPNEREQNPGWTIQPGFKR